MHEFEILVESKSIFPTTKDIMSLYVCLVVIRIMQRPQISIELGGRVRFEHIQFW